MAQAPPTEPSDTGFTLLGDEPYERADDPLGFDEIAEDLARLIVASRGASPFTLGIEASWGMGKSTLMRRLEARLKPESQPSVETAWFNAWTTDETGALEGLIKTALMELGAGPVRRALRNQKLMGWMRLGVTVVAGLLRVGDLVDRLWERAAIDPQARNQLRALIEQAVKDWRDNGRGAPKDRVLCVFVDDLDRCSPGGVHEVLEAMKLYLDVRGLVFVVGYDRDIVSDLILQKKGYTEAIKGRDYLEKIIQITYRIPRAGSDKVIELTNACLAESRTGDLFDEAEVALVAEQNERNPRRIKRFLNGFVLTYGLDPQWREFEPGTLIRAQLLYMHFKSFADLLYRPYERDPVDEFVEYDAARDVLRRRAVDPDAWKRVERAFESHKLPPPGGPQEADFDAVLRRLEEYVPVPFPSLAAQDGFGSLLESLGDAEDWPRLRARLAEGAPPTVVPESIVETGEPEPKLPEARLDGLRVLWVDDTPERIRPQVERVADLGASVRLAANGAEAGERLDRDAFDVLVSDITRGGDPEAGLKDLRRFRAEGVTVPPAVVYFTSRITPARQSAAAELGATIVATTQELLERLADQVKTPQARTDEPNVRVYYHPADEEAERIAAEIDRRLPLFRVKPVPGYGESHDEFGRSVVLVVGPAWTSDAEKAPVPERIDVLALVGGAAKPPSSRLEATPGRVVSVRPDKWDEDLAELAQLARNAIW